MGNKIVVDTTLRGRPFPADEHPRPPEYMLKKKRENGLTNPNHFVLFHEQDGLANT